MAELSASAMESEIDLLDGLTEPQLQAVTHVDGPLLVLAGAGSGKTRVVTRRIGYLIREVGIAPWNVLAITFTNKAAGEMRSRVGELVSRRQAESTTVSTFHSLCARLLRIHGERLGLASGFSIYDMADQQKAVKMALAALEMSTDNMTPGSVLHAISNAKNELLDPAGYAERAGGFYEKQVARVYAKYQQVMTRNNAVDFDDLLLKTVTLVRSYPDVLAQLRGRYQYLLIDEYQDTNHAQFILAHALAAEHGNICATGDPDQSIYGWRGANISNILDFEEHYPNASVVRLEQNYRSTKAILAVADSLIRYNLRRKHKGLWTENEAGEPVRVLSCQDEYAEARKVVARFEQLRSAHDLTWSSFAVFYRVNSLSRVMEDVLREAGIPYQIVRGTAFYDRKEVKDAVAYFRAIANPADEVNLVRIINLPARGLSPTTVKVLQARAAASGQTLDEAIRHAVAGAQAGLAPAGRAALNSRAVNSLERFAHMVDAWRAEVADADGSLGAFVEKVLDKSGLQAHYAKDKSDMDGDRLDNLGELISFARQFENDLVEEYEYVDGGVKACGERSLAQKLEAWLERISLVSDVDALDQSQGAVMLMTLHAAKGLEFPAVAMIGVEDGLLPHERSIRENRDIEEERRLCFVGITRAQRFLSLSHTRYRTVFGTLTSAIPSRFLDELPHDQLEREMVDQSSTDWDEADHDVYEDELDADPASSGELVDQFPPGTRVVHHRFGLGRIMTIAVRSGQTSARVEFQSGGVKTLILEYARLERLSPRR